MGNSGAYGGRTGRVEGSNSKTSPLLVPITNRLYNHHDCFLNANFGQSRV